MCMDQYWRIANVPSANGQPPTNNPDKKTARSILTQDDITAPGRSVDAVERQQRQLLMQSRRLVQN